MQARPVAARPKRAVFPGCVVGADIIHLRYTICRRGLWPPVLCHPTKHTVPSPWPLISRPNPCFRGRSQAAPAIC